MRRVGWTRAIWVFNCNFLQRQSCTAVPQIWCVESSFPPWRLPVKDFVIACVQAWKITHRFLTRSWTPLVLTVISKESTCMHTYTNTCTHWLSFSHYVVFDSLRPHELQHTRLLCPLLSPEVCSNSCSLSWWCHPNISSSVTHLSSCPHSFSASGSFPMSWLFTSGGQRIGSSASASVLLVNIQDWFPLGWTGWISLKSKGLSRVFTSTTVQKHQFFGTQLSL